MTRKGARSAFLRSYHIPSILPHYPRVVRSMRRLAILDEMAAATCIRDLKAGRRWSSEAVNRYGELIRLRLTHAKYRRAISLPPEALREMDCGMFAREGREG